MPLKFPIDAITDAEKVEYAYLCQETLRLEHNAMGARYNKGRMTSQEFQDWLDYINPDSGKPRHSASEKTRLLNEINTKGTITQIEWEAYQDITFRQREQIIIPELLKYRDKFKESTKWTVDLDNLE